MGTLKTTNIESISGSGTVTLGVSGETFDIPSGVTLDSTGATITGALTNTPSFRAFRSSTQSISDNTLTKVEFDSETFDTDNTFDNSTNYRFTPGVSGKYYVFTQVCCTASSSTVLNFALAIMKKNGSEIARNNVDPDDATPNNQAYPFFATIVEMNTTDYIEIFAQIDVSSGTPQIGDGTSQTYFGAYKLIGA